MNLIRNREVAVENTTLNEGEFNAIVQNEENEDVYKILKYPKFNTPFINIHFLYDLTYDDNTGEIQTIHGIAPESYDNKYVLKPDESLTDAVRKWSISSEGNVLNEDDLFYKFYFNRLTLCKYVSDESGYISKLETLRMAKLYDLIVLNKKAINPNHIGPEFFQHFKLRLARNPNHPYNPRLIEMDKLARKGDFMLDDKGSLSPRLARVFTYLTFTKHYTGSFQGFVDIEESKVFSTPGLVILVPNEYYLNAIPNKYHTNVICADNQYSEIRGDKTHTLIVVNAYKIVLDTFKRIIMDIRNSVNVVMVELHSLNVNFKLDFNIGTYGYTVAQIYKETGVKMTHENKVVDIPISNKTVHKDCIIVTKHLTSEFTKQHPIIKIKDVNTLSEFNGKIVESRFSNSELNIKYNHQYRVIVLGKKVYVQDINCASNPLEITEKSQILFTYRTYILFKQFDPIVYQNYNVKIIEHGLDPDMFKYNNNKYIYKVKF